MGHVDLVKAMLEEADYAIVGMSTCRRNNSFQKRKELFMELLAMGGVPSERVSICTASDPFDLASELFEHGSHDPGKTPMFVGADQERLAKAVAQEYGCPFTLNPRTGSGTVIRHMIDKGQVKELQELYMHSEDAYNRLIELRTEELTREKPASVQ